MQYVYVKIYTICICICICICGCGGGGGTGGGGVTPHTIWNGGGHYMYIISYIYIYILLTSVFRLLFPATLAHLMPFRSFYVHSQSTLSWPCASCVILMSLFASSNTRAASQNTWNNWSWGMATNIVLKYYEGKGKIQKKWRRKWRYVRSWEIPTKYPSYLELKSVALLYWTPFRSQLKLVPNNLRT